MKLPFDFGIRLLLRLVAPGALLAAVSLPAVRKVAALLYPGLNDAILFVAAGLIFGFALLLLDMPIYMLLEGRRFWPRWLRRQGLRRQTVRVEKLKRLADQETDPALQVEYDLRAGEYPIDRATGRPVARYPTRLGNLLASFETYPTVKFGIDGVFYWPRLWVTIDKDLREELDSAQAVVDGAVYTSAVFGLSAFICLGYWAAGLSPIWWHWPAGALTSLLLARIAYLIAIPRYGQYGQLFEALFDQYRDKLKSDSLVRALDGHMGHNWPVARSEREQWRATWRFLRWHRYRDPVSGQNDIVQNW